MQIGLNKERGWRRVSPPLPAQCDRISASLRYKLSSAATAGVLLFARLAYAQTAPDGNEFCEKKIRPVLASKCYACHGEKLASSELRLDFKAGWERGGNR